MATLENLFPKYTAPAATTEQVDSSSLEGDQTISVVMLGGDSTVMAYHPFLTIHDLKNYVQVRLGPAPQKQRLLYKEQELKVRALKTDLMHRFSKKPRKGTLTSDFIPWSSHFKRERLYDEFSSLCFRRVCLDS